MRWWLINKRPMNWKFSIFEHSLSRSLGLGEQSSIEYALQTDGNTLLIMDDALARKTTGKSTPIPLKEKLFRIPKPTEVSNRYMLHVSDGTKDLCSIPLHIYPVADKPEIALTASPIDPDSGTKNQYHLAYALWLRATFGTSWVLESLRQLTDYKDDSQEWKNAWRLLVPD